MQKLHSGSCSETNERQRTWKRADFRLLLRARASGRECDSDNKLDRLWSFVEVHLSRAANAGCEWINAFGADNHRHLNNVDLESATDLAFHLDFEYCMTEAETMPVCNWTTSLTPGVSRIGDRSLHLRPEPLHPPRLLGM